MHSNRAFSLWLSTQRLRLARASYPHRHSLFAAVQYDTEFFATIKRKVHVLNVEQERWNRMEGDNDHDNLDGLNELCEVVEAYVGLMENIYGLISLHKEGTSPFAAGEHDEYAAQVRAEQEDVMRQSLQHLASYARGFDITIPVNWLTEFLSLTPDGASK